MIASEAVPKPVQTTSPSFDPRLSSLRGLGSLWVAASHVVQLGVLPLAAAAAILIDGYLGVALFFALSVYLLLGSLQQDASLTRYFRRRVLRIWPLYIGTVLAVWLLWNHSTLKLVANLTFTAIWIPGADYGYTFWSLQVEELAYLFFPLISVLSDRGKRRVAVGLIAFSGAWAILLPTANPISLPFPWLCAYGWGILARVGPIPNVSRAWPALFVPAIVPQIPWELSLFALCPVFASLIAHPPRALEAIVLVFAGEVSYSLYLVHKELLIEYGWVGLLAAFPLAALMELGMRGRQVLRRLGGARATTPSTAGGTA